MGHPRASYHRRYPICLIFILLTVFLGRGYSQQSASEPAVAPPAADSDEQASDVPDTLAAWLDALARAESGNRGHLVHRDRDGQLYYGCLQFQARTFRVYVKKLRLLPTSNRSQLMSRIYDCSFQKRLAAAMIRDDPSNWKHWRWTVERKVGLPPSDTGSDLRNP